MQLKEVSLGQAFRFVGSCSVYIALNPCESISGMRVLNLDLGIQYTVAGQEKIEIVTLLPIVLKQEDLENLDRLIAFEEQSESHTSRVTRLLEGEEGAIVANLQHLEGKSDLAHLQNLFQL